MIAIRAVRAILFAAAAAGLAVAAAWSVRLAWADAWFRTGTVAGTEKALSLTPDQAEYSVRLALLVSDEDPARAAAALRRAVELNPCDARAWIELGLRYEANGDLPLAELTLRRAAEEDRTYLPRWTLMNYYFRRNDGERFWFWAKSAVPMIWGDPLPLFQLSGRVKEDGELIGRLDIRKPELEAAYLFYLLDAGRADLAGPSIQRLLESNREKDLPLLLEACDRLLAARHAIEARAIWDRLMATNRIRAGNLRTLVNNGDFAVSPTGKGFDWHLSTPDGISAAREVKPAGLRFTLSGSQPESTELLFQLVPVEEDTAYELTFDYTTSGIPPGAGLSWHVNDQARNAAIAKGESLSSDSPADQRIPFVTPLGCRLLRIALAYQRCPGTTRVSGFVIVRNVVLRNAKSVPAAQPPSSGAPLSRVR